MTSRYNTNYLPDPDVPKPRRVGINGARRWLKSDVIEYLQSREVVQDIEEGRKKMVSGGQK